MQYKISFTENGHEFLGTTEHFTTDGRYNLDTVHEVALDVKSKLLNRDSINGYNVRRNSFNSPIIATKEV